MFPEKRHGDARDPCEIEASVLLPDQPTAIPCVVADISVAGARLQIEAPAELTKEFTLALPLTDEYQDKRIVEMRWQRGKTVGVRFVRPAR